MVTLSLTRCSKTPRLVASDKPSLILSQTSRGCRSVARRSVAAKAVVDHSSCSTGNRLKNQSSIFCMKECAGCTFRSSPRETQTTPPSSSNSSCHALSSATSGSTASRTQMLSYGRSTKSPRSANPRCYRVVAMGHRAFPVWPADLRGRKALLQSTNEYHRAAIRSVVCEMGDVPRISAVKLSAKLWTACTNFFLTS